MEDRTTFRISCMYISSVPIFIVETAMKLHLYDYDGNVIHLPRTSHTILYPGHLTLYSTQDISHYTLPRTSHTILYPGHLTLYSTQDISHYTPTQDTSHYTLPRTPHTILYPGHLTLYSTQDISHYIYSTQDISHYTLPRTPHTLYTYPGHLTHYTLPRTSHKLAWSSPEKDLHTLTFSLKCGP